MHGFTGFSVPDNRGFPLVSNTDGGDMRRPGIDLRHGLPASEQRGLPDIFRIVLHPARLRIVLRKFLLANRAIFIIRIEQNSA